MDNPIAIVTGGSRGLGRSTALKLGESGIDVLLTYRESADRANEVVRTLRELGRRAAALPLDLAKSHSFAAFSQGVRETLAVEWQKEHFDYLVNNGGIGLYAPFDQTSEADFDALMNVQLKGTFFLTQALLPLMADGGKIVNVSTGLTRFSLPGYAAYAVMKGGVEVLTRYLAKELGPRGIAVNTIAPGAIETDFGGGVVRDDPQLNAFIASQTALGRVGLPDDIGSAVTSLLHRENGWITGQRIEASGGMFL